MRPQVGELINNKYRLVRMIGDGGMGSVFEAKHEVLGNSVALKFLHSELARRAGLVQRFLQEARVSVKIQSPHVVRVTDVEQTPQGLPFIVMEFLQGKSLQALYEDLYKAGKRLGYDDALNYAIQMLDGLEAAHDEGIVHRDLKPDNVMIVTGKRGDSVVKLLDFGIAKLRINGELYKGLTRPGVIMGTPEYMAPEQVFSADAVDARADIFSCGVMIFEMLAGRRPVGGDEAHQIAAAYLSGGIAKLGDLAPQIDPELASAIHKAMAADPKDRFGSVAEFRAAVEPFANRHGKPAITPASVATPAPVSPVADARTSNVPRTIPPVDGADASSPDVSLGADGGATEKVSEPWRGDDPASISAKLSAAAGGRGKEAFDSTVEGAPFFPGSTEAYQEPIDAGAARPGGTAVGGGGVSPATAAAGTVGAAPYVAPTPGFASAAPARAPTQKKKSGLGVFGILLIGAGVSAALMGGLYAYDQMSRDGSSKDDAETLALPTTKKVAEQPPAQPQPQPQPQPQFQPQPQPQPQPTTPTTTTTPKPQPGPKPTTTTTTPGPQPWVIPSTSPIPLPTAIPGWPPDLGFPGTQPPAQPTSTSTGGGGRPKLPPITGDLTPTKPAPTTTTTSGPTRPTFKPPRVPMKPAPSATASAKPTKPKPASTTATATQPSSRPRITMPRGQ